MKEERCDRCECIVGLGCACLPNGVVSERRAVPQHRQEWRRFPADTILISQMRYAHRPGACAHLTEELVTAPRWGCIPEPPHGALEPVEQQPPSDRDRGGNHTAGGTTVRGVPVGIVVM